MATLWLNYFNSPLQYQLVSIVHPIKAQAIKNPALRQDFLFFGVADGARTRDPRRDRPVL